MLRIAPNAPKGRVTYRENPIAKSRAAKLQQFPRLGTTGGWQAEEGQRGAGKTDKIHHGAVCEICGRTVTETEYSYGASNCCQGDIVPQEKYDRGLPDEGEIEAPVRAGVGASYRDFNRPRPRRKDRIIEHPHAAATAARILQDIGTDKGRVSCRAAATSPNCTTTSSGAARRACSSPLITSGSWPTAKRTKSGKNSNRIPAFLCSIKP